MLSTGMQPASATVQGLHSLLHPRFPADCEAGTRQRPGSPKPACPSPCSGKGLPPPCTTLRDTKNSSVSFESLPPKRPKETVAPTLDGRREETLMFLFTHTPRPRLSSRSLTQHLEAKLRESLGVRETCLVARSFCSVNRGEI